MEQIEKGLELLSIGETKTHYPQNKVGFAADNFMILHEQNPGSHPERPARLMLIYTHLEKKKLTKNCVKIECPKAEVEDLLRVHTQKHIDYVSNSIYDQGKLEKGEKVLNEGKKSQILGGDVFANKYTAECAFMSAGGSVEACKSIFERNECSQVFAAIRPPGHHANSSQLAGFCLFNNAAIATKYLQDKCGLKKICIFDWDIHVGDGTSNIFYEDDSVLYVSIHRYDNGSFYPGQAGAPTAIGKEKGTGYNIHYGFNTYDSDIVSDFDYIFACESLLFPIIKQFGPEAIIISCGFDSAQGDPLGGIGVTPVGYAWMTHGLMKLAPNVIVLLEGGYDLDALANSSEAVLQSLKINGNDEERFSKLLVELNSAHESYDELSKEAMKEPRPSFVKLNKYIQTFLTKNPDNIWQI